jgi:hypothetical protein
LTCLHTFLFVGANEQTVLLISRKTHKYAITYNIIIMMLYRLSRFPETTTTHAESFKFFLLLLLLLLFVRLYLFIYGGNRSGPSSIAREWQQPLMKIHVANNNTVDDNNRCTMYDRVYIRAQSICSYAVIV